MEGLKQTLANNLVELRKTNQYTQAELGEILGFTDKAVSKWEHGEATPDLETLVKLSELYQLSLDEMIHPLSEKVKQQFRKQAITDQRKRIIYTILDVLAVWVAACVLFFFLHFRSGIYVWRVFIWAIPVSAIVLILLNRFWGKRKYLFFLLSLLLWSFLTAVYLHFLRINIWPIFLIGVPLQASVILMSQIKK